MKYIIENNNLLCREHGTTISEIMEKMYAIEDNIEFIVGEYIRQFPKEVTPQLFSVLHADQISVDICSANDEFYIENGAEFLYLEVVSKEIAEMNDHDFLSNKSVEELKTYKVGETLSYYTKLTDTDYYFRFM